MLECLWCLMYDYFFVFKQKTAYEMRISDWSSDVCSSDLLADTALSVSDCQYHSALAPLAIWLRCSMVCNAKGYTFDWGAYSPSSPSSSLSSSSGSGSSGRDPRSGKAALRPAQAICARS